MRDIAMAADVPVALVNFHGGAKEALFETVVARRAETLARHRIDALETARANGNPPELRTVLGGAALGALLPVLQRAQIGSLAALKRLSLERLQAALSSAAARAEGALVRDGRVDLGEGQDLFDHRDQAAITRRHEHCKVVLADGVK